MRGRQLVRPIPPPPPSPRNSRRGNIGGRRDSREDERDLANYRNPSKKRKRRGKDRRSVGNSSNKGVVEDEEDPNTFDLSGTQAARNERQRRRKAIWRSKQQKKHALAKAKKAEKKRNKRALEKENHREKKMLLWEINRAKAEVEYAALLKLEEERKKKAGMEKKATRKQDVHSTPTDAGLSYTVQVPGRKRGQNPLMRSLAA